MSERCTDDNSSAHLLEALRKTSTTRNMASPNAADASSAPEPTKETSGVISKAANPQKGPPPESKEGIWLRRTAILSFWAVVVLLGLPIWWKTTAIYRAELPLQDMTDWAEGKVPHVF
jgi:phosphatidylinositol glycan class S